LKRNPVDPDEQLHLQPSLTGEHTELKKHEIAIQNLCWLQGWLKQTSWEGGHSREAEIKTAQTSGAQSESKKSEKLA